MQYTMFGATGIQISRVAYGGIVSMKEEQRDSNRFVSYAIEKGVNYFDVAPSYGNAEEKLGESLQPYRKNVTLACKTDAKNARDLRFDLENSLKKLHTDYFDVYQFHSLSKMEDLEQIFADDGAIHALDKAKQQGVIRFTGFSAHNEEVALKALELYDFDMVLFPVNWALGIGKKMGERLAEVCWERQKGFLGMKALAHRLWLPGEERIYPKSWCKTIYGNDRLALAAIKYALSMGVDAIVPPGNFEQFSFAAEHIDECVLHPLMAEELSYLQQETNAIGDQFIF